VKELYKITLYDLTIRRIEKISVKKLKKIVKHAKLVYNFHDMIYIYEVWYRENRYYIIYDWILQIFQYIEDNNGLTPSLIDEFIKRIDEVIMTILRKQKIERVVDMNKGYFIVKDTRGVSVKPPFGKNAHIYMVHIYFSFRGKEFSTGVEVYRNYNTTLAIGIPWQNLLNLIYSMIITFLSY